MAQKYTISKTDTLKLRLITLIVTLVLGSIFIYFRVLHSEYSYFALKYIFATIAVLFVLVSPGLYIHELIHALAWSKFGRVPFESIKIDYNFWKFDAGAICHNPISSFAYKISLIAPFLILCVSFYIVAFALDSLFLFLYSLAMGSVCSSDLLLIWKMRSISNQTLKDLDTEIGAEVLEI